MPVSYSFLLCVLHTCVCVCWCVSTQGILERLNAGEVVVGDGGYVLQLERRGYVKAGDWTPEAAVEHPEAGTCYPLIYLHDTS